MGVIIETFKKYIRIPSKSDLYFKKIASEISFEDDRIRIGDEDIKRYLKANEGRTIIMDDNTRIVIMDRTIDNIVRRFLGKPWKVHTDLD